jgi:DNA mismatch endonuclease, patch repair protein
LQLAGWRLLTIWECSLKGPARRPVPEVMDYCTTFIRGNTQEGSLVGKWPGARKTAPQHF